MTLEGKRKVGAPDAFPVVGDTDESAAPILDVDHDVPAASIKAVFNKLFNDCGGPFNHLAGGDTAHHLARKHLNRRRTARSGHRITLHSPCPSSDFGEFVFRQLGFVRSGKLFKNPLQIFF